MATHRLRQRWLEDARSLALALRVDVHGMHLVNEAKLLGAVLAHKFDLAALVDEGNDRFAVVTVELQIATQLT